MFNHSKKIGVFSILIILIILSVFSFSGCGTQKSSVAVYFVKLAGTAEVTEAVTRPLPKGSDPMQYAIEELFKGPTQTEQDKGYFSEIPDGTKIIDIKDAPTSVYVNLNEQFVSGGGSNSVTVRMKQVRDTLLAIEKHKEVYLNIAGKPIDPIGGEGLEVEQPLQPQENNN